MNPQASVRLLAIALSLFAGLCHADVVDVTDENQPVPLTNEVVESPPPIAVPIKPKRKSLPRKKPAAPVTATKLEGALIKRNLEEGSPTGPLTEIVAEALEIISNGKVIRTIRTPMFIREWDQPLCGIPQQRNAWWNRRAAE